MTGNMDKNKNTRESEREKRERPIRPGINLGELRDRGMVESETNTSTTLNKSLILTENY